MTQDLTGLPFSQLVDAAPDGIVVVDERGVIVLVNAEADRMFGYPRDALLGQLIEVLVPIPARARHLEHVKHYQAGPRLRPMGSGLDLQGRRHDGSELPVEICLSPIRHAGGSLVVAGIRDVTDRRRIEREARRANAYLLSAVDTIQDAFVLYDEDERVVMVNRACRQLYGSALGDTIQGRKLDELLSAALTSGIFDLSDETRESLYQRWLAYHRAPIGTLEVRTGRGRHLRIVARQTPEHGTVTLMMDVTDHVAREAELRTASAAKTEFLSSMSHELRTPLNAVLGFAQLLEHDRKEPLSERQLERLQYVLRGGEHLRRLIDDVLDLSSIEASRISMSCEPVELADLLADVATTLEPMAASAQIKLELVCDPAVIPQVLADRTRLAQILRNFGSNAIKYGKLDGHARFEVVRRGERVRIEVIDDGIGIPIDQRAKLFEPFHRAGQETGPIEGTGIGLAISKRLAELMHGRVGFSSEAGQGSRFWVELPVAHPAAVAEAAVAGATTPMALATPLAGGAVRWKLVYVEDNPSNLAFMRGVIDDLGSVELLTAPTAELGLELIRAHLPAAVIMDINLPGMSGLDAVKQLAQWPETRDIPIVGLSAAALARDTTRAKQAGFYRYLTKPVKIAELTAVLEELLVGA